MNFWDRLVNNLSSQIASDPGVLPGILFIVTTFACSAYLSIPLHRHIFGHRGISESLFLIILLPLSLLLMIACWPVIYFLEILGMNNEVVQMLLATLLVILISIFARYWQNKYYPVRLRKVIARKTVKRRSRRMLRPLTRVEWLMIVVAMTSIGMAVDQFTNILNSDIRNWLIVFIALPLVILIVIGDLFDLRDAFKIFSIKQKNKM